MCVHSCNGLSAGFHSCQHYLFTFDETRCLVWLLIVYWLMLLLYYIYVLFVSFIANSNFTICWMNTCSWLSNTPSIAASELNVQREYLWYQSCIARVCYVGRRFESHKESWFTFLVTHMYRALLQYICYNFKLCFVWELSVVTFCIKNTNQYPAVPIPAHHSKHS